VPPAEAEQPAWAKLFLRSTYFGYAQDVEINDGGLGNVYKRVVASHIKRLKPNSWVEQQAGAVFCPAFQYLPIGETDASPYMIWGHALKELYLLVLIIAFMSFHKENSFGFT
jgi:hypothetical protein